MFFPLVIYLIIAQHTILIYNIATLQHCNGKSGPALTPSSLDLELSQRALTMCKEDLALKDSQLRELSTKSQVLTNRVKLLEAEVNRLLTAEHISPSHPNPQPQQNPTAADCHHCDRLVTVVSQIKEQLFQLSSTLLQPPSTLTDNPPPAVPMPVYPPSFIPATIAPGTSSYPVQNMSTPLPADHPLYQQHLLHRLPPQHQQSYFLPPLQQQCPLPSFYPQQQPYPPQQQYFPPQHQPSPLERQPQQQHTPLQQQPAPLQQQPPPLQQQQLQNSPPLQQNPPPLHSPSPSSNVPQSRPHVQLSEVQIKLMTIAGQVPQQHHQKHQQQKPQSSPKQQQSPIVPLMSLKVPFPRHLRSHPRVHSYRPRIPRNKLFRRLAPHTDPNPILNNLSSLN